MTNIPKNFTLQQIRSVIPQRCFQRNQLRFLRSLLFSTCLFLITMYIATFIPFEWKYALIWLIYALINGTILTGVWVLGHQCGHKAFSRSQYLNNFLGFILHNIVLVPYFSWQWSHYVHHQRTNHIDLGQTHVPIKKNEASGKLKQYLANIIGRDILATMSMFMITVLGWPFYLLFGVTGSPKRGFTSHFLVPNNLFPIDKMPQVVVSNIGLAFMGYIIYYLSQVFSFRCIFCLYFLPYFIVNAWLTFITYLQHTETYIPHYDDKQWNWLRGALCTVDRNYPKLIDVLHFHIGTTHVLHHLFSEIPHYHAVEATQCIKKLLGSNYKKDDENIFYAFWRTAHLLYANEKSPGIWFLE